MRALLLLLGQHSNLALHSAVACSRSGHILAALGGWEDCQGCQVLRPGGMPNALVHWLGGVFVSPSPHVAYGYMLEKLVDQGYLVVATPFTVDFDYRKPAAVVHERFVAARTELVKEYGELPQLAAGHSLGALMQVLLCSLYPEYGKACAGAALVSYNNKPASDAIPLFEQAFVPALAPLEPLTRNQALIMGAKDSVVGLRRLGFQAARGLAQASPLTQLVMNDDELTGALRDAEALASLTDQIPDVLAQISRGASEFSPSPNEVRQLISDSLTIDYPPLVISFEVDGLDESSALEEALSDYTRVSLPGTHLTPLAARRLLVPSVLRPDNLLFDADGLVAEIDRYFTVALDDLTVKRQAAAQEVVEEPRQPVEDADASTPNI